MIVLMYNYACMVWVYIRETKIQFIEDQIFYMVLHKTHVSNK